MLTSKQQTHKPKRSKIRYTEYYDLQETFDKLYADSGNGKIFTHLMDIITSDENIKLAYRTIKRNNGSNTPGVDGRTILWQKCRQSETRKFAVSKCVMEV